MEGRIYLNHGWKFNADFKDEMMNGDFSDINFENADIPHTVKVLPFHYFDESEYQMVSAYRRWVDIPMSWKGKRIVITFEGAAHDATVYVNGIEAGSHHNGYTAFSIDITDKVGFGDKNLVAVKLDSRESINVPPFGYVIDYMTYGGIYRDVYIEVKNSVYIEDVFVMTKLAEKTELDGVLKCSSSETDSKIYVSGAPEDLSMYEIRQSMRMVKEDEKPEDSDYKELLAKPINREGIADDEESLSDETADQSHTDESREKMHSDRRKDIFRIETLSGTVNLWDINNPSLYEMKTELMYRGETIDKKCTIFGFRKMKFTENGFYLNGKKVKIRGLNRHQSYPYVGYAMPDSMQIHDAEILKYELGCNAVRTSHYPQAQSFVDACDRLGILVFTEFPGWQHIGDESWKKQAFINLKEMIQQYRNHPSIMLWGVRINESVDDHEFYAKTNEISHALDPSRPTGGVRCYKKGDFQEDVFTYNDFVHCGDNKGCEKKRDITSDDKRPYFVSEYNGHMYPTKMSDSEEHKTEHMLRHANVLNSIAKEENIAGSFGWCMFDYNTHKDFGSGDRICYHGVMDMFRNPKLAAYIYAAQQEENTILKISSSMDIGEHPGSNRGDVYIITNADSVKMYKNDIFIKEYKAADSEWKNLKHGPIRIDDYIGDALSTVENMPSKEAEDVKELLNAVARTGLYGMNRLIMAKAGYVSLRYHLSMEEAVELYNKYIGNWGGTSTSFKFEAYKDGGKVSTLTAAPMKRRVLCADQSVEVLKEGKTYDVAEIRINMQDENGNVLAFYNDAVSITAEGPIEIIGPNVISLSGGMGGTYVRTTGAEGKAVIIISAQTGEIKKVSFEIHIDKDTY